MNAIPTFSPAEVQKFRIDNELNYFVAVVSSKSDPRADGLSKSMFVGDGAADVFETLCALWGAGILPLDSSFLPKVRLAAKTSGMPKDSIAFITTSDHAFAGHAGYLAGKIREAYLTEKRIKLRSEINDRDMRGENVSELEAELEQLQQPIEQQPKKSFRGIDAAELEQFQNVEPDWLVRGIFSADQPTIFGAASKATKTTQLIDLAVALATETPWLGHFQVPRKRKTLLITGESNNSACSKRVFRALKCRSKSWADLNGSLRVETVEFPVLPSLEDQQRIAADVAECGFEVVIIDPLYRGLAGLDINRMPEVASAVVSFSKAVQPASLIISHHVTKSSAKDMTGPPSLEDLSGAGLAESCGNWWLLGRNEPYKFNKIHDLVVQFGGRDEQAGVKRIVFNEADWSFEITGGEDLKEQRQRELEDRRQRDRDSKLREAMAAVRHCLANQPEPRPKRWVEDRAGQSQAITRQAIAALLTEKVIEERDYQDSRKVTQRGLVLAQCR